MNGLDRFYKRSKDFGVRYFPESRAGDLDGDRHARGPPDRPARCVRSDRGRRKADAADDDPQGRRRRAGRSSGRIRRRSPRRASRSSALRPRTSSRTSWPATPSPRRTRSGASGRSTTSGTRRPAAYKTGTTNDNRDVHAYGYLAPPKDTKAPALAVGVWMGNSDNVAGHGTRCPWARPLRSGRGS